MVLRLSRGCRSLTILNYYASRRAPGLKVGLLVIIHMVIMSDEEQHIYIEMLLLLYNAARRPPNNDALSLLGQRSRQRLCAGLVVHKMVSEHHVVRYRWFRSAAPV